jgi:hypothetical protein
VCSKILLGASITFSKSFAWRTASRNCVTVWRGSPGFTDRYREKQSFFRDSASLAFQRPYFGLPSCARRKSWRNSSYCLFSLVRKRLSGTLIYPRKSRIHCESKRKTRPVHIKPPPLHAHRSLPAAGSFFLDRSERPSAGLMQTTLIPLGNSFRVGNLSSRPTAGVSE